MHVLPNSLSLKAFLLQLACNEDIKTAVLRQPRLCGAVCIRVLCFFFSEYSSMFPHHLQVS